MIEQQLRALVLDIRRKPVPLFNIIPTLDAGATEIEALRARVAELEARLKTPYCACSWDANDNVVGLCGAHAAKVETLRDAVLNDRGFLAEAGMTSDQTNAVLATIDALWPTLFSDGLPANKSPQ